MGLKLSLKQQQQHDPLKVLFNLLFCFVMALAEVQLSPDVCFVHLKIQQQQRHQVIFLSLFKLYSN